MQNLPRRFLALTFALFTGAGFAQAPPDTPTNPSSSVLQRRTMHFLDPGNGAWTADQIATMSRIRDAAVSDDYALMELRHLTNNIGPRLSGSAQAVEYVAGEMRALGATVTLEKTTVPHWVTPVRKLKCEMEGDALVYHRISFHEASDIRER